MSKQYENSKRTIYYYYIRVKNRTRVIWIEQICMRMDNLVLSILYNIFIYAKLDFEDNGLLFQCKHIIMHSTLRIQHQYHYYYNIWIIIILWW